MKRGGSSSSWRGRAAAAGGAPRPFNLGGQERPTGAPATHRTKHYSDEERDALLEGFVTVPRDQWEALAPGSLVRYQSRASGGAPGEFRWGGWVRSAMTSHAFNGATVESKYFTLQYPRWYRPGGNNGHQWYVAYDDVEALWMQPDAVEGMLMTAMANITAQVNKRLEDVDGRLRALEKRLHALETS